MKSNKRRNTRFANLLFFIPLILIVSVVIYGYIQLTAPGTLKVEAIGVDRYLSPAKQNTTLQVTISVAPSSGSGSATNTGTTPVSFSLTSGTYTVTYDSTEWYSTPSTKSVSVPSGNTVYAVGVYEVIPDVVSITQSGFNSTKVFALHALTPVIWINTSNSLEELNVQSIGNLPLQAGQNYTKVFFDAGSFSYSLGTVASGTVIVS